MRSQRFCCSRRICSHRRALINCSVDVSMSCRCAINMSRIRIDRNENSNTYKKKKRLKQKRENSQNIRYARINTTRSFLRLELRDKIRQSASPLSPECIACFVKDKINSCQFRVDRFPIRSRYRSFASRELQPRK